MDSFRFMSESISSLVDIYQKLAKKNVKLVWKEIINQNVSLLNSKIID